MLLGAFGGPAEAALVAVLHASGGDVPAGWVALDQRRVVGHVPFSCLRAALAARDVDAVFVFGDPACYCRFAFPYAGTHFIAIAVHPGALGARAGFMEYPAAFGAA